MKIGYCRVSTQDQNLDAQRDALKGAGCETIYEEKITGAHLERPELLNCLKSLRKGDTLVVWKLDRLGRSLKDLIHIVNELDEKAISFQSLTNHIDTSTPSGKLFFHLFGALAEYEAEIIRQRTLAGLAASRSRGRLGGRPQKLSKEQVRMAKAMLKDPEMTYTSVAKHFKVTRTTLRKYLNEQPN